MRKYILSRIPLLWIAAGCAGVAAGFEFQRFDGEFALPFGTNLSGENVIVAESMKINGKVDDDVFLLAAGAGMLRKQSKDAGRINLDGKFGNDVWAWGSHLVMRGEINDHARLGGFSATIHGRVKGGAVVVANNIHLARESVFESGVELYGENVICEGMVADLLRITGVNVTLSGTCRGNVEVRARDLVILPGTSIEGNLEYLASKPVVMPAGAVVSGETRRIKIPPATPLSSIRSALPAEIYALVSALFSGILFAAFCPGLAARAGMELRHAPGKSFKTGALAVLIVVPFILALFLSVIGMPAALLICAVLVAGVYLGKLILAVALGMLLVRAPQNISRRVLIVRLALGLIVLHTATFALYAWPVWLLAATMGGGALLRAVRNKLHG